MTKAEFSRRALVVPAAAILLALLPGSPPPAAAQNAPVCPPDGPAFTPVDAITSQGGHLKAVMKVVNGNRTYPTTAGSPPAVSMLRYFEGYNPADPTQKWPTDPSVAGPGPTLSAQLGDVVNITLLNQVKVQDFGGSLDSGEEGRTNGCDQVTKANPDGTVDKNWYPANDRYPNCFHGSSSANLHFHGTHVTPATTGDNILVNVRPDQNVTERDVEAPFSEIFRRCELGKEPQKWADLARSWRDDQKDLLIAYDKTAPYVGPGRNPDGHGLPPNLQLWPQNEESIAQGVWPQWYIGSYPFCFQIPRYTEDADGKSNVRMGQAPGTHWYHSHKHGSTSINLFNGLAGALLIKDSSPTGYDGKLQSFYGGKLDEKVFVIQQITATPNLLSAKHPPEPQLLFNGLLAPVVTMQPGQVQLWRLVNASVQGFVEAQFSPATSDNRINYRRTAVDGVQLAPASYGRADNGTLPIKLSPANRIDLLVQAPASAGCYELKDKEGGFGTLLYVNVTGDAISPAQGFPAESDFPVRPKFLNDIEPADVRLRREITYGARAATATPPDTRAITQFTIDGKQFEDQMIDQVMLLGATEEWTLSNTDTVKTIAHPFHIHVNPFQITEIFDPNTMTEPEKQPQPYVWWDTFAIPKAKKNSDGTTTPGWFKMRTRFVDFTGRYVQHCHILAHEDRGMMQLIEVVSNKTIQKHH